tara:strand:+ start:198 stop:3953 length:3756 start_codon:yes stop_codon:yes gene_type:complete
MAPLEVTIRPEDFEYAENPFALEEEWLGAFDLQAEIDRKTPVGDITQDLLERYNAAARKNDQYNLDALRSYKYTNAQIIRQLLAEANLPSEAVENLPMEKVPYDAAEILELGLTETDAAKFQLEKYAEANALNPEGLYENRKKEGMTDTEILIDISPEGFLEQKQDAARRIARDAVKAGVGTAAATVALSASWATWPFVALAAVPAAYLGTREGVDFVFDEVFGPEKQRTPDQQANADYWRALLDGGTIAISPHGFVSKQIGDKGTVALRPLGKLAKKDLLGLKAKKNIHSAPTERQNTINKIKGFMREMPSSIGTQAVNAPIRFMGAEGAAVYVPAEIGRYWQKRYPSEKGKQMALETTAGFSTPLLWTTSIAGNIGREVPLFLRKHANREETKVGLAILRMLNDAGQKRPGASIKNADDWFNTDKVIEALRSKPEELSELLTIMRTQKLTEATERLKFLKESGASEKEINSVQNYVDKIEDIAVGDPIKDTLGMRLAAAGYESETIQLIENHVKDSIEGLGQEVGRAYENSLRAMAAFAELSSDLAQKTGFSTEIMKSLYDARKNLVTTVLERDLELKLLNAQTLNKKITLTNKDVSDAGNDYLNIVLANYKNAREIQGRKFENLKNYDDLIPLTEWVKQHESLIKDLKVGDTTLLASFSQEAQNVINALNTAAKSGGLPAKELATVHRILNNEIDGASPEAQRQLYKLRQGLENSMGFYKNQLEQIGSNNLTESQKAIHDAFSYTESVNDVFSRAFGIKKILSSDKGEDLTKTILSGGTYPTSEKIETLTNAFKNFEPQLELFDQTKIASPAYTKALFFKLAANEAFPPGEDQVRRFSQERLNTFLNKWRSLTGDEPDLEMQGVIDDIKNASSAESVLKEAQNRLAKIDSELALLGRFSNTEDATQIFTELFQEGKKGGFPQKRFINFINEVLETATQARDEVSLQEAKNAIRSLVMDQSWRLAGGPEGAFSPTEYKKLLFDPLAPGGQSTIKILKDKGILSTQEIINMRKVLSRSSHIERLAVKALKDPDSLGEVDISLLENIGYIGPLMATIMGSAITTGMYDRLLKWPLLGKFLGASGKLVVAARGANIANKILAKTSKNRKKTIWERAILDPEFTALLLEKVKDLPPNTDTSLADRLIWNPMFRKLHAYALENMGEVAEGMDVRGIYETTTGKEKGAPTLEERVKDRYRRSWGREAISPPVMVPTSKKSKPVGPLSGKVSTDAARNYAALNPNDLISPLLSRLS